MIFQNWIKKTGIANVAKRLKVSESTVYRWLSKERSPSDRLKGEIVRITKRLKTPVTYKDIIE